MTASARPILTPEPPLDDAAFAVWMAVLGPFETAPHLSVATSGGADSLCLTLLADAWARARGGRVTALTVDHGLRTGSAQEAATVAAWLAARNIAHHTLCWGGKKPTAALQEAARQARYQLLEGWCRDHGVLHLLLGHHGEDQAETYLMRRARGSGPDGLAAMPVLTEGGPVRKLRPLLAVAPARLRATLENLGQDWIEDPSNGDRRFERVRVRQDRVRDLDAGRALDTSDIINRTARFAQQREQRRARVSVRLARFVALHPTGFAQVHPDALLGDDGGALWQQVLMTVGGRTYPPERAKLTRALENARQGRAGALAGCLWRADADAVSVIRENRGLPDAMAVRAGGNMLWDNRFRLTLAGEDFVDVVLAPLGVAGWNSIKDLVPSAICKTIPHAHRLTLPTLFRAGGVSVVAGMGYKEEGTAARMTAVFRPPSPLGGAPFLGSALSTG